MSISTERTKGKQISVYITKLKLNWLTVRYQYRNISRFSVSWCCRNKVTLGRVASFVKENQECSANEVEEKIESLCHAFEEMKPYLIERWVQG